jgi:hypothetical protein
MDDKDFSVLTTAFFRIRIEGFIRKIKDVGREGATSASYILYFPYKSFNPNSKKMDGRIKDVKIEDFSNIFKVLGKKLTPQ